MRTLLLILLLTLAVPLHAQYIPVHPTNGVYVFLDELANEGIIELNTATLPRSRMEISRLLVSVDPSTLNARQQKELVFFLKDFNKEQIPNKQFQRRTDLFYYRDSSFSVTINPIGGGDIWFNENGMANHWWNGAGGWATLGKFGIYASLRDNHESLQMTKPSYLNQNMGGANFKPFSDGHVDYWESRGGVTYDFGKGAVGLVKDHFEWGDNAHGSNIFSGRTPSFAHFFLYLKPVRWLEFRYVHGWLVSEVVDSSRSFYNSTSYGTSYRKVYHSKFMAANLITLIPVPGLDISLGNSIIYDYDNVHPAYLIPLMFYKPVDHTLQSGIDNMNSQIFVNLSSRLIPHIHMYTSLFLDEVAVKRIFKPDEHNFYSFKGGFRISDLIPNTFAGIEYTITDALTYRHFDPTLTFESNRFNLGHYLTDNAKEFYVNFGIRPVRAMQIEAEYTNARKGPDHTAIGDNRVTITSFTPIVWQSNEFAVNVSWEIINDGYLRVGYSWRNVTGEEHYLKEYTPEYWWGKTGTLQVGLNFGF